jgi:hypothetical protein
MEPARNRVIPPLKIAIAPEAAALIPNAHATGARSVTSVRGVPPGRGVTVT